MSNTVKNWTEWLTKSRFSYMSEEQREQTLRWLFLVRDIILNRAKLKPTDTLIDIGTGTGLLAFGAYELLKEHGKVIASDKFEDCVNECRQLAESCELKDNFEFLVSPAENIDLPDNSVDVAVMRSVLIHILDKFSAIKEAYRILKPGGRISVFEPILTSNTRYNELVDANTFDDFEKFKQIEDTIMTNKDDNLTNFDEKTLAKDFAEAGFKNIDIGLETADSTYTVTADMVEPWFNTPPSPNTATLKDKFLKHISEEEINTFIEQLKKNLDGKEITVSSATAFISAEKV